MVDYATQTQREHPSHRTQQLCHIRLLHSEFNVYTAGRMSACYDSAQPAEAETKTLGRLTETRQTSPESTMVFNRVAFPSSRAQTLGAS